MTVVTQFVTADGTDTGALTEIRRFYVQNGKAMDKAMESGMVLVMSLWDDHDVNMPWLDSTYPTNGTCDKGACRGTCDTSSGKPSDVESQHPDAQVKWSNIKYGEIGSTTTGSSPSPAGPVPPTPPTPATPTGCPGGSLSQCMGLCPSSPASAYKTCVSDCVSRCP